MHINFEQRLREAVRDIKKYGMDYADAKAISWNLQEMRKVTLASEINKLSEGSATEREARARGTETYRNHIDGTTEAIRAELKAKAHLEAAKAKYEALRSLCSLHKKEVEAFEHESDGDE